MSISNRRLEAVGEEILLFYPPELIQISTYLKTRAELTVKSGRDQLDTQTMLMQARATLLSGGTQG